MVYWGTGFDPPYAYNSGNISKSRTTYTVTGLSDDKTYYFAAKAFNAGGLGSGYSNVVSTDDTYEAVTEEGASPEGSGGGSGGCFMATAVYDSKTDLHVKILSKFRDKHIVTNWIGRSIVDGYYRISPPIADYLHKHQIIRYSKIYINSDKRHSLPVALYPSISDIICLCSPVSDWCILFYMVSDKKGAFGNVKKGHAQKYVNRAFI